MEPRIRWFDADGVRRVALADLPALLDGGTNGGPKEGTGAGWVWLDVPVLDAATEELLVERFGLHLRAVQDCRERNHVPKVHVYADHLILVLHSPEGGHLGHVHYVELDQVVGPRFLVTVHGPVNPEVSLDVALREADEVARRVDAGRLRPASPFHLSYALVTTVVRHEEELVAGLAREVGLLEQDVMAGGNDEPEEFLDRLYRTRHKLLTVRTMATQTREIYSRLLHLARFVTGDDRRRTEDVLDQYTRLWRVTDGQLEFLHGVTEYYRARTDTKMTIAAERLAVIAALTLPVTAVSSVMGMNVIVNAQTHWAGLIVLLVAMTAMSLWLLRWAKRRGWW